MKHELSVLYEDNHLLVVEKPTGLATVGVGPQENSLVKVAKEYLKQKYHKPGNVYLGVVSRLDALVSGVVVLARTSKAAGRLSEQFRAGTVRKRYWAIVSGPIERDQGTLVHWLYKDDGAKRMRAARDVPPADSRRLQRAELSYRVLGRMPSQALLEIELLTGRKHQIRVQLAAEGWPIQGDKKYGSTQSFASGIALHSVVLQLLHPSKNVGLTFRSPPPASWRIAQFQVDFESPPRN